MKANNEEMYGKSTQGTHCWKLHSVDFNAAADNTHSVFIHLAVVASKSTKSHEILQKFKIIAVQGHPRSSILVAIQGTHATSY